MKTVEEIRAEIEELKAKRAARLSSAIPQMPKRNPRIFRSYDHDGTPQHRRCEDAPCCGCC